MKIKWNKKKDKMPRRPLTGGILKGKPPSMWQEIDQSSKHPLSRTSSVNNAPKKSRAEDMDQNDV